MDMNNKNNPIMVTRSSMPPFEEYVEMIQDMWENRWLTNMGIRHEELSKQLKEEFEARYFLLFSNGHMALELALQSMEMKGEVITTPFTFISTTQAIVRNGLTPVFCDIDPVRLTIDPDKIEDLITENTCAIVGVHVYGIPCDTLRIEEIAKKYKLKVIYDAAHAFHVRYLGRNIAGYGDVSMYSFHATKVFHTIEGGGVVCQDPEQYERLSRLRNFGIFYGGLEGDQLGVNAKMSEFHAAMGLCNLRYLQSEIEQRKKISEYYDMRFKNTKGFQIFPDISGLERNYAYYPLLFPEDAPKKRDEACDILKNQGVIARKYFYPLTSEFHCFKNISKPGYTPVAKDVAERVLCLPLYSTLALEDAEIICNLLLESG